MANDEFEWFGEGFDGFPKRLPEDCVDYTLHIFDTNLSEAQNRRKLQDVLQAANALTKKLLKEYIWQNESFTVQLVREDGRSFLRGRTNYGDSIEDEWLIVYILRELSQEFPEVWIRVFDADGEFLLIEAANALPRWLNPEVAENRVWLNKGNLLIIPLQAQKGSSGNPSVTLRALARQDAQKFIEEDRSRLQHSTKLEAEAFFRLQKYPKQINDNLHHALATIPRKLAYVLHQDAAYISPAVGAFYLRDPIAMRPLHSQDIEHLVFPPTDLVTVSTKFTKVGYAQLKSQHFPPPQMWLKTPSASKAGNSSVQVDLGMKITSGFEMLLSDPYIQDNRQVREIKMLLDDIKNEEVALPSDPLLASWGSKHDDDSWLDINFEDFENVLDSKRSGNPSRPNGAFGDRTAQENLGKIVSRFEDFLQDDTHSDEGPEYLDEMDKDNDDEEDDNEELDARSIKGEDRVSFDEAKFATLMREMMGLPERAASETNDCSEVVTNSSKNGSGVNRTDSSSSSDTEEYTEIRQIAKAMESELRDAGALRMDPFQEPDSLSQNLTQSKDRNVWDPPPGIIDEQESEEEEEVDIDYNLAKNLLNSFKSQGGVAGPSGNLMNIMGMRFPRDEDDGFSGAYLAEEC